jgi:NAD(P)-dependent dehydrogenase (short-subunit alcohol dehydrogenase family)
MDIPQITGSSDHKNARRGMPEKNFSHRADGVTALDGRKAAAPREEKMNVTMKDRVAVVTGGSKGIGLAVAGRFAESGAKVAMLARGAQDLKAAREHLARDGMEVRDYVCDVSKAAEIAKTHDRVVADLGPIDVLVNNAGTSRAMAFETVTDEIWQEDLDLKLFAAIRFSRLVWPGMKARKWGRIINVLNIGAKAPAASSTPTSVSRAAGMALTKAMANEGGPHNILVNAMLVGLIVSDQWVKRHAQKAPDTDFDAFTGDLAKGVPLGRMGTAEEFANLACFLASEQGSYITGTAINVDGGRSPVV